MILIISKYSTIQSFCEKDEESIKFCAWLKDTLETNYKFVKSKSEKKGNHDSYWYQIYLFFKQLEGLKYGIDMGIKRARRDVFLEMEDLLLLNAKADLEDLKMLYIVNVDPKPRNLLSPSNKAKILLKFTEKHDQLRIIMGHSSEGILFLKFIHF